jgi:hypothetical protein
MEEKFEGERGIWNPELRLMYSYEVYNVSMFLFLLFSFSKGNKRMHIPETMKAKIPLIFLDGELW